MKVPGIPYVQGKNVYTDADGKKYGIAIHNTSNDASDENEASYAKRRTDGISSHFYCDKDSVTQSIDTKDRCGHAGSNNGNQNAISVEITGANAKSRQWWIDNVAWDKLAYALAYVIKNDPNLKDFQVRRATVSEMKSNPKVKAFYSHDDMRRAWGGTTHTDPGPNFPWDHFLASVKKALTGSSGVSMAINAMFCAQGDKGEVVQFWQVALKQAGFYKGAEDGDYGPATAAAVGAARKAVGSAITDGKVIDAHAANQILIHFVRHWQTKAPEAPTGGTGITFPMTVVFNGTISKA